MTGFVVGLLVGTFGGVAIAALAAAMGSGPPRPLDATLLVTSPKADGQPAALLGPISLLDVALAAHASGGWSDTLYGTVTIVVRPVVDLPTPP